MMILQLSSDAASNGQLTNQILTWLAILGSAAGVLAVFGRGLSELIKSWIARRSSVASVDVEKAKVKVTEKEAQTHEISVIFEGMTAAIEAVTNRAESAENAVAKAQESITDAHARIDTIQKRMRKVEGINDLLVEHIKVLEAGYPSPPGPPTRPNWTL